MQSAELGSVPCLFLYSADDRLCDASKVDELFKQKQQRQGRCAGLRWAALGCAGPCGTGGWRGQGRRPQGPTPRPRPARRGDDVERRRWDRSEHVGHLKLHGREYLEALASFLERKAGSAAAASKL
jgi:hypothetical protein